jgi:hypothetical protein
MLARPIRWLLPLTLVATMLAVAAPRPAPAGATSSDEAAVGQDLISFANRERSARGLPGLSTDSYATQQAQAWAQQMQSSNTLSHRSNFASAFAGYPASGENVGTVTTTAGDVHRMFMGSDEHRRNILQPGFDGLGVGVACSSDGRMWVTVDFVARSQTVANRYNGSIPPRSPQVVTDGGHRCPQPTASASTVGTPGTGGYWLGASDGGIFAFGDVSFLGSMGGHPLNAPITAMAGTADHKGYWMAARDGGIFNYGDARFYGSTGGRRLNAPVVGVAARPPGGGYWLVASDGGIFNYGAGFYGSRGGQPLNAPIVGMAGTRSGNGYWLVASDGGIFSYGDARFYGSTGGRRLNAPIVGMAATPDGGGYWLVARDGGVFNYGDAHFYGSAGGLGLRAPIVSIARTPSGGGYWLLAADGGVFNYGNAGYRGSTGGLHLNAPIVGGAS